MFQIRFDLKETHDHQSEGMGDNHYATSVPCDSPSLTQLNRVFIRTEELRDKV